MAHNFPPSWDLQPIEECMDAIIDYRGKSPRKTSFGIPLVTAKIVKGGRILPPDEYIHPKDFDVWMRRGMPEPSDIVVTTEAPLGEIAQLDGRKVALAQRLITLRGRRGRLDNTFLKFAMQSDYVQHQLRARATGTTVIGIRQSELRQVLIFLPPLPEQKAIAHILGTLDDKIELNRRMNETLEAMARAIFKSWFVDFDPVRIKAEAKAQGRSPNAALKQLGLSPEIAALFPDSFQDSKMGKIPREWQAIPIGDAVRVLGGGTPRTEQPSYWDGGTHPFCTPKDMSTLSSPVLLDTERHITDLGVAAISSGKLPVGTVLLSSRAPIGYIAVAETSVSINQGIIAMICDGLLPNLYVLYWTRNNMDMIEARANGSTFMEISKTNFRPILSIVPSSPILEAFIDKILPLHRQIVLNLRQSQVLTMLRDSLLPKLLSGEIRIEQLEGEVAEAILK